MSDLRYPIGDFELTQRPLPAEELSQAINVIEAAPGTFRAAVAGLSTGQLDTPYRPEGWTVRQVIHHVPDSHVNMYVRFRLALTEEEPVIKPYPEALWAELPDARTGPVEVSLDLLDALHRRWVLLMRAVEPAAWSRVFRHPERGVVRLDQSVAMYAWHCRHHLAHINGLRGRMGW